MIGREELIKGNIEKTEQHVPREFSFCLLSLANMTQKEGSVLIKTSLLLDILCTPCLAQEDANPDRFMNDCNKLIKPFYPILPRRDTNFFFFFFSFSAQIGDSPVYPSILKHNSYKNCQNQFLFPCTGEVQHVLWLYG